MLAFGASVLWYFGALCLSLAVVFVGLAFVFTFGITQI